MFMHVHTHICPKDSTEILQDFTLRMNCQTQTIKIKFTVYVYALCSDSFGMNNVLNHQPIKMSSATSSIFTKLMLK